MIRMFFSILFLLLLTISSVAQGKFDSSENRLSLSFGTQYNFNKDGIQNDPNGPRTISASNTAGGYVGLGYERKTRKGLVFSYDLQLRNQPHEVFVDYDLVKFDPRASQSLTRLGTFSRSWEKAFFMLDNRFMAGYEHAIGKAGNGWYLQEKVGFTLSHILSGIKGLEGETATVTYVDDTSGETYNSLFIYILNNFDINEPRQPPLRYFISGYSVNLYLGLVKKVNKGWLKSVSFGVEGRFSGKSAPAYVSVQTTSSFNGGPGLQEDTYNSTYRSLGLHLALNFWK